MVEEGFMIERSRWLRKLFISIPLIMAILLMIPRLVSAQFGFFDDAEMILTSRAILDGNWDLQAEASHGRFRIVYWLFNAGVYALAGDNPAGFAIVNILLLLTITASVMAIANFLCNDDRVTILAGVLLVLSGPVIENFYTFSKPEGLQLLWLLLSILAVSKRGNTKIRQRLSIIASSGFIFLATVTKETAIVVAPISLSCFLLEVLFLKNKRKSEGIQNRTAFRYLIAAFIGVASFFAVRQLFVPERLGTVGYASYYNFEIERIITSTRAWIDWLNRDFLYLIPLLFAPLYLMIKGKISNRDIKIIGAIVIWMVAWVLVYVPWIWQLEYYLLPVAVGASLLGAFLIIKNLHAFPGKNSKVRAINLCFITLSVAFLLVTLPNDYSNALTQLSVDRANADMIEYILIHSNEGDQIYINIQGGHQYYDDIRALIQEVNGRTDLGVDQVNYDGKILRYRNTNVFIASPSIRDENYQSVRLGVNQFLTSQWNSLLNGFLGDKYSLIYDEEIRFQQLYIDAMRLFCPFTSSIEYCQVPNSPFDTRIFKFGWKIYQLD